MAPEKHIHPAALQQLMPAKVPQSLPQVTADTRADDLEDSISSIAQRVVEEKKQKEGNVSDNQTKVSGNIMEIAQKMAYTELAADEQPREKEESAEDKKKLADEALDNPISDYFADKHPEVVKNAQKRHYLTDQV